MSGSEPRIWYLDTSVVLRIALGHSRAAADWFDECSREGDAFVASRLAVLESTRLLRRENLALDLAEEVLDSATLLGIDDALVVEACAIRVHVRSIDALHLASAARVGVGAVIVASHDAAMIRAAQDLGFDVHDPVID